MRAPEAPIRLQATWCCIPPCCSGRQDAGTYKCQLEAQTGDLDHPDYYATAVKAGSNPALGGTWLQASSSDELGAQWWQNPDCDSEGKQPTCSYVGGSTPPELWIFQNDGTHLDFWEAARNATAASVSATITLTTCHHATASCTDDHEGSSDGSTVSTHLELVQLTPGLGICRVNRSPDATYAIAPATPTTTRSTTSWTTCRSPRRAGGRDYSRSTST